jgi:hypothetical protein
MAGPGLCGAKRSINQSGLADLLEIKPITLGRILDKLQMLTLIERHPHPSEAFWRDWSDRCAPAGDWIIVDCKQQPSIEPDMIEAILCSAEAPRVELRFTSQLKARPINEHQAQ